MADLTERYQRAANSKDLTTKAGREGDIDAIVAVAWNRSRTGAALLRLHSEWDGAAKRGQKLDQTFRQLKALPEVLTALAAWCTARAPQPDAEVSRELSRAVLSWWLDNTCKVCEGTQWVTPKGMPRRPCPECRGSGHAPIPCGNDGREVLAYLEGCLHKAQASIKSRMAR